MHSALTKSVIAFLLLSFFSQNLKSQDLHYTNYQFTPLYFNPANTGAFYGSYRLSAIYRDQFRSFLGEAYQTANLSVDSPILKGFGDHHWIGVGINLYNDRAGAISFRNSGLAGSAAYHISGDKNYTNVFTIGVQYGFSQRTIDASRARFGDTQSSSSEDLMLLQNLNGNYSDLNIGLGFRSNFSEKSSFHIGAAVMHILQPSFRANGSPTNNNISRRLNFDANLRTAISDNFTLIPATYISFQENSQNIAFQLNGALTLNKKQKKKKSRSRSAEPENNKPPITLNLGLGHRVGDAIQFLFGTTYKGWDIGLAYDLTTSSANAYNNGFGGIELGVTRIISVEKKPKMVPALLCPRL